MDEPAVRAVLAEAMPELRPSVITRLGAGQENVAFDVDGALVVRFARAARTRALTAEAELLALVAGVVDLRVPEPVFVLPHKECLAYRRVPGEPLPALGSARLVTHADAVAARLGRFLATLHRIPVERVAGLADVDDQDPAEWLADAVAGWGEVAGRVPEESHPAIERFLRADPPPRADGGRTRQVFSHNDLGIEHVLVDPVTTVVTGIIDWSDAAITDPAYDLGLILRDLGPAALRAAIAAYGGFPDTAVERAWFYARCSLIEDLEYGLTTAIPFYVDKSLSAVGYLFG